MILQAGTAVRTINPAVGDDLCGQLYRRTCGRIRDDLEANLLYLADGRAQVLLIGLDLLVIDTPDTRAIAAAIEARTGIPARNVILCCTHTHAGPNTVSICHDTPKNTAYVARLSTTLVDAAAEAVASARPALIGAACGTAHVGFNRRICWADGTHSMYGDSTRPDFTGLEGPDDPSHAALFVRHAPFTEDAPLAHDFQDLDIAVRLPSDAELEQAKKVFRQGEQAAGRWQYVLQVQGVLNLYETYKDRPIDTLAVHSLRVGDFALATNPCEFYCQFGLDIKRRSPALVTAIAQLSDGFSGYCPTIFAILGGGYSGQAIHWCRLEPYAGYRLVDASARLLHAVFK